MDDYVRSRQWYKNELIAEQAAGKTVGIVGLGKIGRRVLVRCKALGMNILGYDPTLTGSALTAVMSNSVTV